MARRLSQALAATLTPKERFARPVAQRTWRDETGFRGNYRKLTLSRTILLVATTDVGIARRPRRGEAAGVGYAVFPASDGVRVRLRVSRLIVFFFGFDLLITDIKMPDFQRPEDKGKMSWRRQAIPGWGVGGGGEGGGGGGGGGGGVGGGGA